MANRYNSSRATVAAGQRNCNYKTNGLPATHIVNATIYSTTYKQPIVVLSQTAHMMSAKLANTIERFGTVTLVRDAMFVDYYYLTVLLDGVHRCTCRTYQDEGYCDHVEQVRVYQLEQEKQRREEEIAALRTSYPALGYQMTVREVAMATIIKEHPTWFVSNELLHQAMNAPLKSAISKGIDKLRQQALRVTTETQKEVA